MADGNGVNQQEGAGGNYSLRLFKQELDLGDIITGRIARALIGRRSAKRGDSLK